jgi:uncharacterized protein YcbK (DUF882 family)
MKLTDNFSLSEFRCNDVRGTNVPPELYDNVKLLAKNLQVLRDFLGEPIHLNSGYRTPAHNKKVGGESNSFHMRAMAADITCKSKSPSQLAVVIETLISEGKMRQGGVGRYAGFTHYDVRGTKARWNG